jgi:hypothetical protein
VVSKAVIHFECRAPEHQALPSRRGAGGVTVYQKTWAYCDGDGADDAHSWVATGGVPVQFLMRWSKPAAIPFAATVATQAPAAAVVTEKTAAPSRKRSRP